jgi:shikimate dehydrogenase
MNIVLIGMRGSGKSTAGRLLAGMLRRDIIDTDEEIVRRTGLSITEIVAKSGWVGFRETEAGVVSEAALAHDSVIVTGGGVVTRPANIARLKKDGVVAWLRAGVDELVRRTSGETDRPPLVEGRTPREDMAITLEERRPLYTWAADIALDTEGRNAATIAAAIAGHLLERGYTITSDQTKICAIIGEPLTHSLSPAVHNNAYRALGLDFIYVPFPSPEVKPALERVRALGLRGVSVTIPHKTTVLPYLDVIDPVAAAIGAVNTIVNDEGRLTGYNTDCAAAVGALEAGLPLKGRRAVILGAGGMAAAVAFGLKEKGIDLAVLDRNPNRAAALAQRLKISTWGGLEKLPDTLAHADILVNATPVGMWPHVNETIVPADMLHRRLTVLDAVYTPRKTRLLREAATRGATAVYGDAVFLRQAGAQFLLFTGQPAPVEVMRQALLESGG